jgi:hypothetical protein
MFQLGAGLTCSSNAMSEVAHAPMAAPQAAVVLSVSAQPWPEGDNLKAGKMEHD